MVKIFKRKIFLAPPLFEPGSLSLHAGALSARKSGDPGSNRGSCGLFVVSKWAIMSSDVAVSIPTLFTEVFMSLNKRLSQSRESDNYMCSNLVVGFLEYLISWRQYVVMLIMQGGSVCDDVVQLRIPEWIFSRQSMFKNRFYTAVHTPSGTRCIRCYSLIKKILSSQFSFTYIPLVSSNSMILSCFLI